MKKLSQNEIITKLKELEPQVKLKEDTLLSWSEKATFIDIDFGEWIQKPSRVYEGVRHPKRAAINRANTNLQKYGTANVFAAKEIKQKIITYNQENFGVDNPAQIKSVKEKIKNTNQIKYGGNAPLCSNEIKTKVKCTNLKKHGVEHVLQLSHVREARKNHNVVEKATQNQKATNLSKYGHECSLHGLNREKVLSSFYNNFGVDNPAKHENVKIKIAETNIERYGVTCTLQVPEIQERIRQTNIEKYGVEYVFQSEEFISKHKQRMLDNGITRVMPNGEKLIEWYEKNNPSVGYSTLCAFLREKNPRTMSEVFVFIENTKSHFTSIEQLLSKTIDIPKFGKMVNKDLKQYRPDFKINDNLYINVDGLYWHSEKMQKNKFYHFDMRKLFNDQNIKIMQFRQDELNKIDIIKSMIDARIDKVEKIYARNTKIKEINTNDAMRFLENNHLMGKCGATIYVALTIGDEILTVSAIAIKKDSAKIVRFANKLGFSVIGGYSKILKYVKKQYSLNEIISFVDLRYGTVDNLQKMGFKLNSITLGFKWTDGNTTYNRLHCRANMDDRGLSEKQHAAEMKLYKIYDAGQAKMVWKK